MPAATRRISRSISLTSSVIALLVAAPSVANAAPPSNDDLASPTVIAAIPFRDSLSTEEATTQAGEPGGSCAFDPGGTVWYEFTPQSADIIRATTRGSDFDTVVAVWTREEPGQFTEVACDDQDAGGWTSTADFFADAGTQYLIQVGGWNNSFGNLSLSVGSAPEGSISGTVTSSAGGPLAEICVQLYDGDGLNIEQYTTTTAAGTYFFGAVDDGAHTVHFYDCDDRYDFDYEWWNDKKEWYDADDVVVSGGVPVTGIDAELTKFPNPQIEVIVNGPGIVTSEPAGIDCGLDCSEAFEWDTVVTLTATPDPDARFVDWFNCERTQGNQCQVDMYTSRYVWADFVYADTDPPNTTISGGPEAFTSSRSARFDFESSEWPEEFECSFDGGPFEACDSPAQYDDLAEGTHEFSVRALDEVGNVDLSPATRRWTVDLTPPEVNVVRPTGGLYINNQSVGGTGPITVVGMVSVEVRATDAQSGISAVKFEVNGVPVDPSVVTADGDVYRFAFRPSTPGTYDIRARATNRAGDSRSTAFQLIGVPG